MTIAAIATMAETTTIQVSKETAARLRALKVPGLTYDDVIRFALQNLPPEEVRRRFEAWQAQCSRILLEQAFDLPAVAGALADGGDARPAGDAAGRGPGPGRRGA